MNIYKSEALKLMREHQEHTKNLEVSQKCAIITVNNILKETLFEYTNDENHDRVIHYELVLNELENIFAIPEDCHPENIRQFENEK